jgi:uncharacterized protein (DUF1778 family)
MALGNGASNNGPAIVINTKATVEFRELLKARALLEGTSPSEMMREAIADYLDSPEPPPPSSDSRCMVNLRVPSEMRDALKARAAREGRSLSEVMRDAWMARLHEPLAISHEPDEEVRAAA